jgi:hypothetical protein
VPTLLRRKMPAFWTHRTCTTKTEALTESRPSELGSVAAATTCRRRSPGTSEAKTEEDSMALEYSSGHPMYD